MAGGGQVLRLMGQYSFQNRTPRSDSFEGDLVILIRPYGSPSESRLLFLERTLIGYKHFNPYRAPQIFGILGRHVTARSKIVTLIVRVALERQVVKVPNFIPAKVST